MSRLNQEWKVEPHGPLQDLGDGVWVAVGKISMPLGHFPRRMTIVVLSGGRLAVWSAMPLEEAQMKKLEALGSVAFLIVPGVKHRLDIKPWKERFPQARVLCAPGARAAVSEATPVDATADVLGDSSVEFQSVPGVDDREAALVIRRASGTTLVVNDLIANVQHPDGLGEKVIARLFGFGGKEPQMPWVDEKLFVKDTAAVAAALRRWAAEPRLVRIIVSHGDIVEHRPRDVLERIAAELATDGERRSNPADRGA